MHCKTSRESHICADFVLQGRGPTIGPAPGKQDPSERLRPPGIDYVSRRNNNIANEILMALSDEVRWDKPEIDR